MTSHRPLPRRFFARDTVLVARALIGHLLVHETPSGRLVGRIVETEAYRGADDPASHAYGRTPRSEIMFGIPGVAYVYSSYGMHSCLNVVTEAHGRPGAVLLRALEPLEGIHLMRRGRARVPVKWLASGPGRLAIAMRVGPQHNGRDLTTPPLYIAQGGRRSGRLVVGPRIGITVATDHPWRFGLEGHPALSRPFRAPL
ncbi:MAG: DNA-3-methyladenine glycosylase [Armatimonadetes bacterium]|nr:DNA-3-methyladenine glycosylase [Armatimonadota bacterium]